MSSGGASTGTMTQQQPQQNALPQTNGTSGPPGGKKMQLSGGSSGAPTPAGTPVQNGGQHGPSPPPLAAPKFGTLVPNRIFVGGISANTTEGELMQLFSSYGTVKAAKIIQDRAGVSKGYGFITFENEEDARRPLRDHENIVLRERRLNIAPAIKKQPFGRPPAAPPYDTPGQVDGRSSAPAPHQAALQPPLPPFFFGGGPPFYPGAAYAYAPPVPMVSAAPTGAQVQVSQASQEHAAQQAVYQAPPVYQTQSGPPQAGPYASMVFPPIYMPQQYPMVPYDYAVYGAGAAPPSNGGGMPHAHAFAASSASNGGAASPPRGGHCYATQGGGPGGGPAEATLLYTTGPPGHHIFHTTLDPTGGAGAAGGPFYATADGTTPFDPMMVGHPAAMGHHFGALAAAPYAITEDGSYITDHPESVGTPRSFVTATPPPPPPPPPPSSNPSELPPQQQRSTATPVVSILSLDHQQEKDPASMQGGRRPPQQTPPHHNNNILHNNNNNNNGGTPIHHHTPSPTIHHFHHSHPPLHHHHHQGSPQQQQHQQQNRRGGFHGASNTINSNGPRRFAPPPPFARSFGMGTMQHNNSFHLNNIQAPPPSAFGPPLRRPRKNQGLQVRRMGPAGSSANEIGAGDAPLPNQDPESLSAQVEALKL
ncbi:atrophin-1-like isoform X2 [Anthonomus grandis grandis]|nr:atrophin-1-like isoform X2 [Anthonomus grandis grandis]XP_050311497.1 atrophin-1-like isoform X2 [Anthonomus grandis grandis]XP_050311505.1 atrophin-1-like isoform X2 [Anthonomus grandis grandis]